MGGSGDGPSLVLSAYRRWGSAAPARFRGYAACALWDNASERLLLTTDPLGMRPVLYARIDGGLVFSSSLRALLAHPDVPRDLDEGYLAAFLADVVPEPDATFYTAIRRVPAACTLAVGRDGAMSVHEYWRLDLGRRIRYRRDDDYVEQGRALLDQAVRRQLPDTGPVVCQLSGGLDSTAVAATAARLRAPAAVHALTVAPPDGVPRYEPPGRMADERPGAAAVARMHPNMRWEALSSPTLHAIDRNPAALFLALGMPARGVLAIGWYAPLYDRARALGARSVLCGTIGNMTLSWDGLCGMAGMARDGRWLRTLREAAAVGRTEGISTGRALVRYGVKPLLPTRAQRWLDDRRGMPRPSSERGSAIHPDFARDTRMDERRMDMGQDYAGDTDTMRRRWLARIQAMPPVVGPLDDLSGTESRDPLADLDLLEFCFAVPDEQYLRDGTTRWLARRVLADRLPPEVLNETRTGLQGAEFLHRITLQREAIADGVESLERSPLASRVLDVARMKRILADWPTDAATTNFGDVGAVLHRGLHIGQFLRWIEGGNG